MTDPQPDPLAFTPVPRKGTRGGSGWTVERQRSFIAALAETGSVRVATQAVGMSYANVHKLRRYPGAESFCRAWDAAIGIATSRVRDELIDHSVNGVPEPIVFGGKIVGERRKFNHRTMMWVLQHHRPDDFSGGGGLKTGLIGKRNTQAEFYEQAEELRAELMEKLRQLHRRRLAEYADDPPRRAAYELLHGPFDWDELQAEQGGGAF